MGLRRSWWPAFVIAFVSGGMLAGCGSGRPASPAVITVTPARALYDVSRPIVVSNLSPGQVVTISARALRPGGWWTASATYAADGAGQVDLTRTAPLSGSYHGVSAMGLFWSQRLARAGSGPASPTTTTLTVTAGGRRLGRTTVTQSLSGPGVTEHSETIAATGFFGQYFAPPGQARHPAVIVWGGSEGGLGASPELAALFASHGIPSLALAYFGEPALPCSLSDIPLEYFVKAIDWLRSRPHVDPGRVWVESASRGTEAELLVASHWPELVHGIVAAAPSSVAHGTPPGECQRAASPSWALHGRPLAIAPATGGVTYNPDGSVSSRNAFFAGLSAPGARAARIPIGRFKGAVLLISGDDDQLWPSTVFAGQIMAALHGDPAPHASLSYAAAGHGVFGAPFVPPLVREQVSPGYVSDLGGTPSGDEAAHASDWPAAIRFILAN